jgi:oligopeptide/dipeptide ABC transporter ATP-binding protein
MYGGKVAEYGPADRVYNTPQHPYTQRLLAAFPDLNQPGDSLAAIPGYPPRLNALPPGCRFEPRCDQRLEVCARVPPKLIEIQTADGGPTPTPSTAKQASRVQGAVSGLPSAVRHVVACHLCTGPEAELR